MRRSELMLKTMQERWAQRDPKRSTNVAMRALYADGVVVWGWVVLAETELWEAGTDKGWGAVVYSHDPFVLASPEWLAQPCAMYWRLRVVPGPQDPRMGLPGWRRLRGFTRNAGRSYKRVRLPALLSQQRVVYFNQLPILREELPGRLLNGNLLPIVVIEQAADQAHMARVLPPKYWPTELVVHLGGAASSPEARLPPQDGTPWNVAPGVRVRVRGERLEVVLPVQGYSLSRRRAVWTFSLATVTSLMFALCAAQMFSRSNDPMDVVFMVAFFIMVPFAPALIYSFVPAPNVLSFGAQDLTTPAGVRVPWSDMDRVQRVGSSVVSVVSSGQVLLCKALTSTAAEWLEALVDQLRRQARDGGEARPTSTEIECVVWRSVAERAAGMEKA